jgi:hypothetical protein
MCFESMGGKDEAMKKRRKIRYADPRRQEKKRLQRLQQLKEKMAEMQKKKEEEAAMEEDNERKRKREENNDDATDEVLERESKLLKTEDEEDKTQDEEEEELNEEAKLLESALDTMQQDVGAKTREEAEADRQKLLAGELLVEGDEQSDDEDETGYTGDGARHMMLPSKKKTEPTSIRSLPLSKEDAELLREVGVPIVSDEETKIVGGNEVLPWRQPDESKPLKSAKIKFRTKFDIVELDANGRIVDKGDEDFTPSSGWTGRKAGFEFKLGARGLGYYRTGKKVVVPSNTAY